MLALEFESKAQNGINLLCLGAHCDDIEIGCGGTILKLAESFKINSFFWVTFCSNQERAKEANNSANLFLEKVTNKQIIIKDFRDGFLPYIGYEVKEYFESLKKQIQPDIIFTHYRHDLHQDHRLICELTWNTFRGNFILEYEIPKYDSDLGSPNSFVILDEEFAKKKVDIILENFKSQNTKEWFSRETLYSLLKLRAVETNAANNYAEAFYCRKSILQLRDFGN
jgi:LmbE family N-acetylglucosaminyl deacetylase